MRYASDTDLPWHCLLQFGLVTPNAAYGPNASCNGDNASRRQISLLYSGHNHYDLLVAPALGRRLASSSTNLLYMPAQPLPQR